MCIHIYIYIYREREMYNVYIHIYIYREREREYRSPLASFRSTGSARTERRAEAVLYCSIL